MKNSRGAAASESKTSAAASTHAFASVAAVALDASLITIKIVDTRPEEDAKPSLLLDKALPSKHKLQSQQGSPASQSQSRHQQRRHHQQQPSPTLRLLVALAPNTIFACVSGVLGLVGACAVALLALVVLVAACVVQFFQGMALMLVETDRAMLRFTTGAVSPRPPPRMHNQKKQPKKKKKQSAVGNAGSDLAQTALSLLSLSCELLSIGFFKGTIGLSYCCSLYGAMALPFLIWTAGGSAATALESHSFEEAPVTFVLLHGGLWAFALLWLFVTGSMSQYCSQNLNPRR